MDGKPSTSALAALATHTAADPSRQRDRFAPGPAGSSSLRTLPGASSRQQQQRPPIPSPQQQQQQPSAFDLAHLQHALPAPSGSAWAPDFRPHAHHPQQALLGGPGGGALEEQWARASAALPQAPAFAQDWQRQQQQQQPAPAGWSEAFHQQQQQQQPRHELHPAQSSAGYQAQQAYRPAFGMGMGMGMGLGAGGMMGGMYGAAFAPALAQQPATAVDKGKGKAQADAAWDTAFGAFDTPQATATASSAQEGQAEVEQSAQGKETEVDERRTGGPAEFERAWAEAHLQPTSTTHAGVNATEDLASWESQFSQFANGTGESAEDAYREMLADQEAARDAAVGGVEDALQGSVDERGWPRLGAYAFESTNQYVQDPAFSTTEPPSSLSDRALVLEARLQQSSTSTTAATVRAQLDEAATWLELGETQTQDEKELAGMRALEAARRAFEALLSPRDGADENAELTDAERAEARDGLGRTLISLAVSYTNEAYDEAAYLTLQQHLALAHPAHARPLTGDVTAAPWELHTQLTEGYLAVVRDELSQGRVVPESQMALGLLNYSQGEFERSADCWGAALSVRPDEFRLWNRLGATLANGGKPEEAIEAYRRALELNPTFTRAVYNLGVSCLNIGVFREAAEHLLSALSLHERSSAGAGRGEGAAAAIQQAQGLTSRHEAVNQSLNLWATLRRALYSMDRPDLAEKAVVGADLNQFRGDFEF